MATRITVHVIRNGTLLDPRTQLLHKDLRISRVSSRAIGSGHIAPEVHAIQLPLPFIVGSLTGCAVGRIEVPIDVSVRKRINQRNVPALQLSFDCRIGNCSTLGRERGSIRSLGSPAYRRARTKVLCEFPLGERCISSLPLDRDGSEFRTRKLRALKRSFAACDVSIWLASASWLANC